MCEEFIKDIKRRLKKSNDYIMYFSTVDIERLLNIIEQLGSLNVSQSKYIKELEEKHIQEDRIINIYIGG